MITVEYLFDVTQAQMLINKVFVHIVGKICYNLSAQINKIYKKDLVIFMLNLKISFIAAAFFVFKIHHS